jgi:hypothetical protein
LQRERKIILGEMRASGFRRLLVYCGDYKCAHDVEISADRWRDDVRLSALQPLFVCKTCGHRGGDVRPLFDGNTLHASNLIPRYSMLLEQDRRAACSFTGRRLYCCSLGSGSVGWSGGGFGTASSPVVVDLSSDAAVQSPAQSLVPLTVPTSLQPIGAVGFAWTGGFPSTVGLLGRVTP